MDDRAIDVKMKMQIKIDRSNYVNKFKLCKYQCKQAQTLKLVSTFIDWTIICPL